MGFDSPDAVGGAVGLDLGVERRLGDLRTVTQTQFAVLAHPTRQDDVCRAGPLQNLAQHLLHLGEAGEASPNQGAAKLWGNPLERIDLGHDERGTLRGCARRCWFLFRARATLAPAAKAHCAASIAVRSRNRAARRRHRLRLPSRTRNSSRSTTMSAHPVGARAGPQRRKSWPRNRDTARSRWPSGTSSVLRTKPVRGVAEIPTLAPCRSPAYTAVVTNDSKRLLAAALSLPREDRIELVNQLLESLSAGVHDQAWLSECQRRLADIREGRAETFESDDVELELERLIDSRDTQRAG